LALAADFPALHADWPGLIAVLACGIGADGSPHHDVALSSTGSALRLSASAAPGAPSIIHYYTPIAVQPRSTGHFTHGSCCRAREPDEVTADASPTPRCQCSRFPYGAT
jgi:hypothetical protein